VWDYVSEFRQPTGPLSTAQAIYEHGEPCWSDIDRGKLLILSPDLSGNLISSHVVVKQEELVNEMMTLALRILFVYTSNGSLTCRENLRHGTDGFTSSPKDELRILSLLKICRPRPGLNPRTLDPMANTLPLDHRGRYVLLGIRQKLCLYIYFSLYHTGYQSEFLIQLDLIILLTSVGQYKIWNSLLRLNWFIILLFLY
jgi:hypothetical protein